MQFNVGDKVGMKCNGWWHGAVEKVAKNGALTVRWEQAPSVKTVGSCDRFTANGVRFGSNTFMQAKLVPLTEDFLQKEKEEKLNKKAKLFVINLADEYAWETNVELRADLLRLCDKYPKYCREVHL